jgi:hypothetical protein
VSKANSISLILLAWLHPLVRLEWSKCIVWVVHLEALGDWVLAAVFACYSCVIPVTLDGLEQREVLSSIGDCSRPHPVVCEGSCGIPRGWFAKANSSEERSLWIPILWVFLASSHRGIWHRPIACETSSGCIATTRTSLPGSKWTSVKNHLVNCICSLEISYIDLVIGNNLYSPRWYWIHIPLHYFE